MVRYQKKGTKKRKRQIIRKTISILLALIIISGTFPTLAYNYNDAPPFPDEEVQTKGYEVYENGFKVEDEKYLKIFKDNSNEPFSVGHYGETPTDCRPLVLHCGDLIIEFNQELSQFIRIELWSEDSQDYLGLLNAGEATGQWGTQGDSGSLYPFDPENGIDERYRVANQFVWDGRYYDTKRENWIYPAEDINGDVIADIYNYIIVFQPTAENTKRFRTEMLITIDYTEQGQIEAGQILSRDELGWYGDPVFMPNGNFTWNYTDIAVYGAQPLEFSRNYNALDKSDSEVGYGWRHTYSVSFEVTKYFATAKFADGFKYIFNRHGDGSFIPPEGVSATVEAFGSGYKLTEQNGTKYYFDANGYLLAIEDVGGNRTSITRNDAQITSVSNDSGTLTFTYSGNKISRITDHTGRSVSYTYNGNGDLVSFLNADGDTIDYTYDSNHRITEISDFNGNTYLKNVYDNLGRVTEQYMADQGTTYFDYDFTNRVSTIIAPDGAVCKYYYNIDRRITAVEDINGQMIYEYENGRLKKTTDRLGNSTTYTRDAAGNTTSITYPDGNIEYYEYNALNLVTKITAKDNTETLCGYDSRGNLTSYTDARGNKSTYTYDENNNMLTSTDALGNKSEFTYDSKGNMLTQTDPLNNVTRYEYDSQGRLVLLTNADGSTVAYEFTTAGKLAKITDADGNETDYTVSGNGFDTGNTDPMGFSTATEYNEQNRPIEVTDAEGNSTTYEYDSVGQLSSTTDALGNKSSYTYDLAGRMTSMTDARGNTWSYRYDAEGRMIASSDPLGNSSSINYDNMGRSVSNTNARNAKTTYEYDAMGRKTRITDAYGYYSRNEYDNNGNLIKQYDKKNNKWEYTYDANNRMVEAIDPLGYITTYVYDANGQSTKTVSALGAQPQSVYDNMGRLIKSIDPEGNETVFEYDILGRQVKTIFADNTFAWNEYNDNGWLVRSIAKDGGITSYTYNKNGRMLTITDALGGVTSHVYDILGRTVSVTDALGGVVSYDYDENGNTLSVTDALGGVTSYKYDKLNRVTSATDALGGETLTEYDENGNVVKVINADGGEIIYSYDLLNRLSSFTDPEGFTITYTYDGNGNQLTVADGRGNTSSTEYDALNRVVKQYDPLGNYTSVVYDADGRMIESVNAEGASTWYEYDFNGNVVLVTDAIGNKTSFNFDNMNRVSTITDARGAVTTYTYTATGQVKTEIDALGGVKAYEYDMRGNLIKETNELGNSTSYTYDALSRPLTLINPLGNKDTFTYDANSRITSVADKNGNVTTYKYDANGNIIETIDALNNSSYFEYDAMNRLIKVTLWRKDTLHNVNEGQVTLYQYDKRGLLTREINASNNSTFNVYDGNGNLIQKTDAEGYVTEYSYDPRNIVEAINFTGGKEAQFAYNRNGELIAMMDWNGTVNFTLDILDRIISVNDHNEKITSYTYDAVGNKTSMIYPDGTTAKYEYDLLGRITKLTDAENQNTVYRYDAASQLVAMAYPNNWNESFQYDPAGQLQRQYNEAPSKKVNDSIEHTFTYDKQGNITRRTRSSAGGQSRFDLNHGYDALNRLVSTKDNTNNGNNAMTTYQYDSLGNLIKEITGNNKGSEYWYNNLNQQVKKQVDNKDTYTYTFDKRGNLIKGVYDKKNTVVETYVYDATNRMVKGVNEAGEESHYIYNGFGHLVANEWIIEKNNYGYTGVDSGASPQVSGNVVCDRHKNSTGQGHINPTGKGHTTGGTIGGTVPKIDNKKFAVIHKDYVLDYTDLLANILMEYEGGNAGLTYRYTYGLQKNNVVIYGILNGVGSVAQSFTYPGGKESIVKLYYHHDRLGSTDYLTDNIDGKATSYVTYDDWGAPTMKPILKLGQRQLDLVTEYTGHMYDPLMDIYYARARMYDAVNRRFIAVDLIGNNIANTITYNRYAYVWNNPVLLIDPYGLNPLPRLAGTSATITNAYGVVATIPTIYISGNTCYVDFLEALIAYGVSLSATNYTNAYSTIDLASSVRAGSSRAGHIYSKPSSGRARRRAQVIFTFNSGSSSRGTVYFNTQSYSDGAYRQIANYVSSDFYYQSGKFLVPLDYFHQLMCAIIQGSSSRQPVISMTESAARAAFDKYLDGEITEDHPEYMLAQKWWSGEDTNSTVAYRSIKQFTSESYRELDDASERNYGMNRFRDVSRCGYNYNRYDKKILAVVNYLNDRFSRDVDPSHIKAIAVYETHMGNYNGSSSANGSVDVMQALVSTDHAIRRLAARGHFDPNEARNLIPSTGYGLFHRMYPGGTYTTSRATVDMSFMAGTIWYMHKGSFARYNPGSSVYGGNVNFVLSTMR